MTSILGLGVKLYKLHYSIGLENETNIIKKLFVAFNAVKYISTADQRVEIV